MTYIKNILLIIFAFVIILYAARNVSLPFELECNVSDTTYTSDLLWLVNGSTHTWDSDGGYDGSGAAKLTPPTSLTSGNGTYAALGEFQHTETDTFSIRFVLKLGTNWEPSASNGGGGLGNKFIDLHTGGTRTGMLGILPSGSYMTFTMFNSDNSNWIYSDGRATWEGVRDDTGEDVRFDNGSSHSNDMAGEYLWVQYITTPDSSYLYVYSQDQTFNGLNFKIPNGNSGIDRSYIGGYYNHYHPTQTSETYMMLDNIKISSSTDIEIPPSAFFSGDDDTAPTCTANMTINGTDSTDIAVTNISSDVDSALFYYPDSNTLIKTQYDNTNLDTTLALTAGYDYKYLYWSAADDSSNTTGMTLLDSIRYVAPVESKYVSEILGIE